MFAYTPKGFTNTPISRYLVFISVCVPVVVSLIGVKYLLDLRLEPFLWTWHQWWRLLLFQNFYNNESEVLFATILFYNYRVLERIMGSHKFISYIIVIYVYTVISTVAVLFAFQIFLPKSLNETFGLITSGPTSILYALFVQYYDLIPAIYQFDIQWTSSSSSKITLTDRIFFYICIGQVSLNSIPSSLISSWIGFTLGILVTREVIPGKYWRVPFWKTLTRGWNTDSQPTSQSMDEDVPLEEVGEDGETRQPDSGILFPLYR